MNKCEELYDYILKSEDILGEIDKVAKSERVTDDMYIYYIYNVITRHISINDFNGISYNLYYVCIVSFCRTNIGTTRKPILNSNTEFSDF